MSVIDVTLCTVWGRLGSEFCNRKSSSANNHNKNNKNNNNNNNNSSSNNNNNSSGNNSNNSNNNNNRQLKDTFYKKTNSKPTYIYQVRPKYGTVVGSSSNPHKPCCPRHGLQPVSLTRLASPAGFAALPSLPD